MNSKWRFVVPVAVCLLIAAWLPAEDLPERQDGTVLIATFNIRIFSDGSRDDGELRQICRVLQHFDLIALQETRDTRILDRAEAMLAAEYGVNYDYVASDPVGRGQKELYAFLFRTDKVAVTSGIAVLPESVLDRTPTARQPELQDDPIVYVTKTGKKYHRSVCRYLKASKYIISLSEAKRRGLTPCSVCNPPTASPGAATTSSKAADPFIREPAIVGFRAGEFDFWAVTIHSIYGDSVAERRAEARLLDDVFQLIQDLDDENDILLMGDFNLGPDDEGFLELRSIAGMVAVNPDIPTSIKDRLYDNIWFDSDDTSEYTGEWGVFRYDEEWYGNDDKAASLAVSDHRPLWARFDVSADDD